MCEWLLAILPLLYVHVLLTDCRQENTKHFFILQAGKSSILKIRLTHRQDITGVNETEI